MVDDDCGCIRVSLTGTLLGGRQRGSVGPGPGERARVYRSDGNGLLTTGGAGRVDKSIWDESIKHQSRLLTGPVHRWPSLLVLNAAAAANTIGPGPRSCKVVPSRAGKI